MTSAEDARVLVDEIRRELDQLPLVTHLGARASIANAYASLALAEELSKFEAVAVEERTK